MRLFWQSTGDSLRFDPLDEEFALYYVEHFQKPFHLSSATAKGELFIKLRECLDNTNHFLQRFRLPLFNIPENLYSQDALNSLHEEWVKLQIKHPNLSIIAEKISRECKQDLDDINHIIHDIEGSFLFNYRSYDLVVDQVENIFGTDILRNGRFNIVVHYDNLGRSTFDKWQQGDTNIFDVDTNDYKMIGGRLIFDLTRSYEIPLPEEYITFCNSLKIKPIPDLLPLGNFDRGELDKARELFLRNYRIEDNPIFLEA
jgi:hypothetical protein